MESLFVSTSIPSQYKTQSSSLPSKPTTSISRSRSVSSTRSYRKRHSSLLANPQSRRSGLSVRGLGMMITCGVTEIREFQFSDTVLKSDIPVLVEFVADWCGPCRLMAPAIDWAAQGLDDFLFGGDVLWRKLLISVVFEWRHLRSFKKTMLFGGDSSHLLEVLECWHSSNIEEMKLSGDTFRRALRRRCRLGITFHRALRRRCRLGITFRICKGF